MSASIRMWTLKLSAYGVCAVCLHVRENFNAPRGRREWCGENAAENAEIERVRERQKNMWLRVFLCELCVACVCVCVLCALCVLCVCVCLTYPLQPRKMMAVVLKSQTVAVETELESRRQKGRWLWWRWRVTCGSTARHWVQAGDSQTAKKRVSK